ncbi:methionine permease [Spathaspora passalidarum NRRL Y-27907]|uniref:Methionine permease n=1 Tax=Spathaspora passalidarum (strain NRRL Y-27907 / 11-Y1) TaxID=619300 RepID=G3ASL2_SPAPN|nr:methionine permease [Spathaspora passalidarum NRRL Y-27907]EGW30698.1 methionine permease [Spathaspora passalidarum NRRL Y-27907]
MIPASDIGRRASQEKLGTLSCISLIVNKIIGTGIFSNPSPIFQYTHGNVGIFLLLFFLGGVIIFCGLLIYLEFALNLPFKNGGELNYLMRSFKRLPKGLTGCIYSFSIVILGFSSGNSYAFGKYVLFAITGKQEMNDTIVKAIGVGCISFCIWLHIKFPNQGTTLFNFLGIFKILILVLIIIIGGLASLGLLNIETTDNFNGDIWKFHNNVKPNSYSIAVALLEVIYSFKGWENVNYVLNEVDNPYHILTVAAPLAVALTTGLYFLVIISYLIIIPKEEILSSGVLIAGIFFNKVFGESITARLLPVFISLSNLGNVLVVSYAHSVVNQELAYNNYMPFSKYFQNLSHSLLLHGAITIIILVAPPSTEIYEFIVNLYIYPGTWINVAISEKDKKISAPMVCVVIFLVSNIFLALFPFVPPPNKDSLAIPYWMFPVLGTSVLVLGGVFYYVRPLWSKHEDKEITYGDDYNPLN